MLLRSIFQLSSRRGGARIPRQISTQIPTFLRKELSTTPQKPGTAQPSASGKPPQSGGSAGKVFLGSAVLGGTIFAAYRTGYLDQFIGSSNQNDSLKIVKEDVGNQEVEEVKKFEDQSVSPDRKQDVEVGPSVVDEKVEKIESLAEHPNVEALKEGGDVSQSQTHDKYDIIPEGHITLENKDLSEDRSQSAVLSDEQSSNSAVISDEVSRNEVQTLPVSNESDKADEKIEVIEVAPVHSIEVQKDKEVQDDEVKDAEEPGSLLEEYNIEDNADGRGLYKYDENNRKRLAEEEEGLNSASEDLEDYYIPKDGKLVLDFLQAIHAAESRQADLDARMYAEQKRALKEKYETELKDAAVRELMLAEEAAMLDKELKRERAKSASALKSLEEQLEEKHKTELEQKKRIAEQKLRKTEEFAKAELAAKIASEKAAQIEKITEANLHINALCMAFYARSEEARRTHSAHKLALGALALEDALSKGLPIKTEIGALRNYLEGIDKDSILDLVLSSLPDETKNKGTDTLLQLNQKFDTLKGTLRHFSLIPPGGGGILAHSVAQVASWLKVKEDDQSGDGIESLITKVESCLADGKIAEAADALEEGVRGTEAEQVVGDWVGRARNRAITEQALTLLQSYATSMSVI